MEATINLQDSCRICMLSACKLLDIFEEYEGRPISEIITEISGVNIETSDSLSKKICNQCQAKAAELYAFRQLCIDSDDTVRYNLLLADECDSIIESSDLIADETLKGEALDDGIHQLQEYFVEDDEAGPTSELQQSEHHMEYDELFINDDNDSSQDGHRIPDVDSIDDDSLELTSKRNMVLIERVETKNSAAGSVILMPSDELTVKMREAHFAKEQQKKHKCPHCDKFFKFPSKGKRRKLVDQEFVIIV